MDPLCSPIGHSFQSRTGTSLIAHVSYVASSAPDYSSTPPTYTSREGTCESAVLEKAFRELLSSRPSSEGPRNPNGPEVPITEARIISGNSHSAEHRRDLLRGTDGGVRLAGGRAGDEVDVGDVDRYSVLAGSTLPPPYSSYSGESWYACSRIWGLRVVADELYL